jgi:hypothetical protein
MRHLKTADPAVWTESRLGTNKFPAQLFAHTAGSADFKWCLLRQMVRLCMIMIMYDKNQDKYIAGWIDR